MTRFLIKVEQFLNILMPFFANFIQPNSIFIIQHIFQIFSSLSLLFTPWSSISILCYFISLQAVFSALLLFQANSLSFLHTFSSFSKVQPAVYFPQSDSAEEERQHKLLWLRWPAAFIAFWSKSGLSRSPPCVLRGARLLWSGGTGATLLRQRVSAALNLLSSSSVLSPRLFRRHDHMCVHDDPSEKRPSVN